MPTLVVHRPAPASGPVPVLYWIHVTDMIVKTARQAGFALVSVEGGLEDCYAGLVRTARHAADAGMDPHRIVTGGSGVGGGLAAAMTLLARERSGPTLAGQLLLNPALDGDSPASPPPTFIEVDAADPLREQGVDYACRIWEAGGQAELHVWPDNPQEAVSREAMAARLVWLRRILG
ncbi:alpha/beta hydrolase fold domain-containing protein [Nonomuraea angiospora]|uniref:alpha/beta hydrolase n=1 Tax=Nonomuraea angiospora TaxID=46172 RepID=UPI00333065E0